MDRAYADPRSDVNHLAQISSDPLDYHGGMADETEDDPGCVTLTVTAPAVGLTLGAPSVTITLETC